MTSTTETEREFQFDPAHFEFLRVLAREVAGIELNESKRELVYGRLARRLRQLGLTNFDQYCQLVKPTGSPERNNFVNCITTNVTSFFRENHHFDFLRDEALPQLMRSRAATRRLRIWSAACSTGQEAYSIAITTAAALPLDQTWDCRVLATDIDSNVVARAQSGTYKVDDIADLSPDERRWFRTTTNGSGSPDHVDTARGGTAQVDETLRQLIYFRVLNLMEPWPMKGPIDIIFCRNVVIYFSKETQRTLFSRFAQIMAPDGYLFIGHSESMLHVSDIFEPVGRTIYRLKGSA